jgi:hypothetical protein
MFDLADAGAGLLDRKDPGWWEAERQYGAVDPEHINQDLMTTCVLGQLYPGRDYFETLAWLGISGDPDSPGYDVVMEMRFGFLSPVGTDADACGLNLDWRRIILQRRAMPGICRFADRLRRKENAAAERAAKAAAEAALPDTPETRREPSGDDPAYIPDVPGTVSSLAGASPQLGRRPRAETSLRPGDYALPPLPALRAQVGWYESWGR